MHLRLSEPLGIDPCVDIVIHKLFGDPKHEPVLINFWFFNEAEDWTEVPAEIDSPTMEQAMEIPHDFRRDTFLNDLYRGRAEAERVERGAQKALERAQRGVEEERRQEEEERRQKEAALVAKEEERRQKEAALVAKEEERVAKVAALAQAERLRSLLIAAGISLPEDG